MTDLKSGVQPTLGQKRFRPVHRMGDGHVLTLVEGSALALGYRIYTGSSWTPIADLPSVPSGMTMARCFGAAVIADALYVLYRGAGSTGRDFSVYKASGYSGSAFGAGVNWDINAFDTGGSSLVADAWYDSVRGFFHVGGAFGGGSPGIYAVAVSLSGALLAKSPLILGGSLWDNVSVSVDLTGTILLTFGSGADGVTYGAPVGYASGAYSWDSTTMEKPVLTLDGVAESYSDSSATDVLYEDRTNSTIYYIRRTATQVYTQPAPSGFSLLGSWTMAHDDTSGDFWLFTVSRARQVNGEIFAYRLQPGATNWDGPALVAGGDDQGYDFPKAGLRVIGGNVDLAYLRGTGATRTEVEVSYGSTTPFAAPSVLQPNGVISTLTPALTFQTSGASAGNGLRAIQVQVLDSPGTTVTWDSGPLTTGWSIDGNGKVTYDLPGAAGLAFGTTNKWQVQVLDEQSAGGSGTWSGYSTQATLLPYHPAAITLASLTDGGATSTASPVTLPSPVVSAMTATWTQADGHAVDQVQPVLLAMDGVTEIGDPLPIFGLTPNVASGGTINVPAFTLSDVANLTAYKIGLLARDLTTLLWSRSDLWEADTNWAPPPAPTVTLWTPNANRGYIDWTLSLDSSIVSVTMQRRRKGTATWTTLETKSPGSAFTDYPIPNVLHEYQFVATNAAGVSATSAVEADVLLPLAYGAFGQILSDPSQPQSVMVPLGVGQDMTSTTRWQMQDQPFVLRTAGSNKSKVTYDQILDRFGQGRTYFIPKSLPAGEAMRGIFPADSDGIVDGYLWVELLQAMHDAHITCHFRSSAGRKDLAVLVENFQEAAQSVSMYVVTFDLREVPYFSAPIAS